LLPIVALRHIVISQGSVEAILHISVLRFTEISRRQSECIANNIYGSLRLRRTGGAEPNVADIIWSGEERADHGPLGRWKHGWRAPSSV